jgi:ribonuclease BN (tRNA processing enzyme)
MAEVIFIGTSDAFGAGGRRQTAILVRGSEGSMLLDCGPTTCTGLADVGVSRNEIDAIAISHFHGDHFGGIPLFLLGARYEDLRTKPLRIAGPPGIEQRMRDLAVAMSHPFDVPDWSFPIIFQELEPGVETGIGPAVVRPFAVHHNKDTCPSGFDVEVDDKRVVFSGDTGWFEELPAYVRGADLFICECTYYERDYEWHFSYKDLERLRGRFDVKRMVITHLGEEMADLRGRLDLETADDGMKIKL